MPEAVQQYQQKEVEVWFGNEFKAVVPATAEKYIRQYYFGTEEEKKLIIKPRIPVSQEEMDKIIKKLT